MHQWNLSIQRQIGAAWLLSGSYIGTETQHLWTAFEANPGVFGPGATTGNINARRVLSLINPTQGQYYGTIATLDDGGTASYNGLLLSAQRRLTNNFTVLGNPTVDHYLNKATFSSPANGTFGNLGVFNIENPGVLQIDFGLSRSFRIVERQAVQIRWEVFNAPNRLNANAPVTALNNTNFGKIQTATDPRIMQFALKYTF